MPLLLYALFYVKVLCVSETDFVSWVKYYLRSLITADVYKGPHLWLIFILILLYIDVIPCRILIGRLDEKKEKILALVIFILFLIRTVTRYLGLPFTLYLTEHQYVGVVLIFGWLGILIRGYLITRPWMRKYDPAWIIAGIIGFAVGAYTICFQPGHKSMVYNESVIMLSITGAFFVTIIRLDMRGFFRFEWLRKVNKWIGDSSYSVLLVHWFVLHGIVMNGILNSQLHWVLQLLLPILLCASISLILSKIIDSATGLSDN